MTAADSRARKRTRDKTPRNRKQDTKPKPRAKRSEALDGKLLKVGRRAFARRGLGGVSLREDILTPAGVSIGSFYYRYETKADLLLDIVRRDGQALIDLLGEIEERAREEGLDAVELGERNINAMFDLVDNNPDFFKVIIREYHSDAPEVRRAIRRLFKQSTAVNTAYAELVREHLDIPLDTELAGELIVHLTFGVLHHYSDAHRGNRVEARKRLAEGINRVLAGGVPALRR